jgi:hypothetical protein
LRAAIAKPREIASRLQPTSAARAYQRPRTRKQTASPRPPSLPSTPQKLLFIRSSRLKSILRLTLTLVCGRSGFFLKAPRSRCVSPERQHKETNPTRIFPPWSLMFLQYCRTHRPSVRFHPFSKSGRGLQSLKDSKPIETRGEEQCCTASQACNMTTLRLRSASGPILLAIWRNSSALEVKIKYADSY